MGKLWGREREQAVLRRLLDDAADGRGSALVLWGDPGIGKSALIEDVPAAPFTVLRCRGTRTESALAFAALHELLWGQADRIDALPRPQAGALRVALGLAEGETDRFLIGAATLTLLDTLARDRPVLVVADDAQWLDDASAQCLAFVARRLGAARVAMLLTAHDEPVTGLWEGLPALAVTGLDDDAARHLVEEASTPGVPVDRVVEAAQGNPLALLELPGVLDGRRTRAAIGPRLRQAFRARIWALSPTARTLLLLVAAEDHGDLASLQRAAGVLRVEPAAWAEVLASGLLRGSDGQTEFRHPLIRTAVYEDAAFAERQAVHQALAEALDGELDLDRRAWHLAAAAVQADEDVAGLLETAADRAWARGASMAASRALERAAALTPAPRDGTARLARAALAAWEGGDKAAARRLLAEATARGPADLVVRRSRGLRGQMEFFAGNQERAHQVLLDDALLADADLAAELRGLAECAAWTAGISDELELGPDDLVVDGPLTSLGMSKQWTAPVSLAWGTERAAKAAYQRSVTDTGEFRLIIVLPQLATVEVALGEWDSATGHATEALRLGEEYGAANIAAQARNRLAWMAAMRGEPVGPLVDRVLDNARPGAVRSQIAAAYWALGLAALGADEPSEAYGWLSKLVAPGHEAAHPTFARLSAGDAVEAGVRTGQDVTPHLTLIAEWAERTSAPWALSMHHRCRALLATGSSAEPHFTAALAITGDRPFEHARTQLLFAEWLRRGRRRAEARPLFTAANDTFTTLGARPWSLRALVGAELGSSAVRPPDALTPQEQRVAVLAARGLTNKEIAAQLYISPRTVGHHLSNVFAKLGLINRAELARVDFDNGMRLV